MINRLVKPCVPIVVIERMILYSLLFDATTPPCDAEPRVARLLPHAPRDVFTVFYAAFMVACGREMGRLDADRGWCERLTRRAVGALQDAEGRIRPPLYAVLSLWWGCMAGREDQHYGGQFLKLWHGAEWWCAAAHCSVNGRDGWVMEESRRDYLEAELTAHKNILLPSIQWLRAMGLEFGTRSTDLFVPRE